ncbi:transglycosylase SLT domain-containing protein [Xanthobacter flavus]|uniref:transglycosylase SLT domain-containing protein n=1 Tax=Xanthobacter flavus TaxID=281 RepID=UPI00372A11CE
MVKIPDIEDFSSRRDFGVDRDVRPAVTQANISNAGAPGAALAGVGRAISGLGGDLQAVADKQKAEQDQLAGFKAQTGYYEMLGNIDRETAEAKKSAAPDGTGWDQTSAGIRQRNTTSFLNGLTDPKLRARFEPHVAEVNRTYETRDRSFVEQQRSGFYKAEIDKYGGATAVALEKNPDSWNDVVGGFAQLLAKSGLPEKDREAVLDKGTRQFAQARIRGLTAQGRFDEAKAFADQEDAREAARVGVTPSAPRAGSPPRAGAMDPRTVHSMFRAEVERQGLVGMVPMDGPKYGIRTGSAEEWANYFTGLAKHESGLKNSTVGDVGDFEGGSRGLLQLSYADAPRYGLNGGKPFTQEQLADPAQNAAAGVAITKQLVGKAGTIRGGAGQYWGPISKEGWTPGSGRDRDLPWNELGSGQSPVPVQGSLTLGAYATSLQNQQQHAQLQQQNAERAAQKQQHEAWVNQFEFGVIDGKVGMADLQLARDNGLVTDAGEYQKLEKLIEDRQGETNILADVIDKIDGQNKAYAFDPLDKDDKKAVEAYSQAYKLGEGIGKQDPSVINRASNVVERTGMIPRDVVGPLLAKFRSTDVGAFTFGMQAMQALYQRSPDVFAKTFGEKVTQSVATWGELAPYRSAQESFDLIKKDSDPAAAAQKEKLLKEADKAMKDAPITAADLPAIFYGNMDYEGPASKDLGPWDKDRWAGGPPMAPAQSAQLQFDYAKLYRENYALAQGDADVAKKTTIQQMQRMWGETRVHGAGGSSAWGVFGLRDRVVKYPPERFYPPVDGSYDWIKGAVEDAVKGNAGAVADWELLPVPETAADVKAGSAPRYGIMVKNDAGVWSELRDQSNQPLLIDFDPKASRRAGQDKAQQEAAAAAGRQAAAGDANRNLYQAGGNPFALMPQEQVAPGPEVNAAMQRRFGPKGGVGSAKIPE